MQLDPVEEQKRELLAQWVIEHFDTWSQRTAWLEEFGKNKPALLADIKARTKRLWEKKRNG